MSPQPVSGFSAAALRAARIAAGLSLEELSKLTGKPKASLSRWENGLRTPHVNTLAQLAQCLGVTPEQLMDGAPARTLAQLRMQHGLSQAQVAQELGVVPSRYAHIELGLGRPTHDQVRILAQLLGLTMEQLEQYLP